MKLLKKQFLKKILVFLLSVVILSVSVGDVFIRTDDIRYTEAGEIVIGGAVITAAAMAQICLVVGGVVVTLYCVGEIIDNKEAIAKAGYDFINSTSSTVDGWIASIIDSSGQEYVYGSEALDLIRETEWEVIQGGLPPDDDNNDDDNQDGEDKSVLNSLQNLVQLTPLAATWLFDQASNLYHKWINGEEMTDAEMAVLEPVILGSCDQYDVAAQWSGESFVYNAFVNVFKSSGTNDVYQLSSTFKIPVAGYLGGSSGIGYRINFSSDLEGELYTYVNGDFVGNSSDKYGSIIINNSYIINSSYYCNFPIFSTSQEAWKYLQGDGSIENAINYAKTYREADWLADDDDWQGVLIDPLTQTNLTLNQLLAIAKKLGLHAIGNNLSPQELLELIKGLLQGKDEDLAVLPEIPNIPAPVPDPALDPIYIPSPDAHPIPNPGENPGTNPKPGTGTDPDPGGDTNQDPEIDLDENDYKVDLRGIFPFCIPFDFVALLNVLDADPVAPKFNFPVVIPALDYEKTVVLDMSIFDDVAKVMRVCEKVSFLIFLMFATSKVIRW